jgi:hypothetical protein
MREWLLQVGAEDGQNRLALTDKGMVFLDKWAELQQLAGLKMKNPANVQPVKASCR